MGTPLARATFASFFSCCARTKDEWEWISTCRDTRVVMSACVPRNQDVGAVYVMCSGLSSGRQQPHLCCLVMWWPLPGRARRRQCWGCAGLFSFFAGRRDHVHGVIIVICFNVWSDAIATRNYNSNTYAMWSHDRISEKRTAERGEVGACYPFLDLKGLRD